MVKEFDTGQFLEKIRNYEKKIRATKLFRIDPN